MSAKPIPQPSDLTAPYWAGAAAGELRTQYCPRCGHHFLYPRRWCPSCWHDQPRWEPVSGRGTVTAFSVIHQAPFDSYAADVPYAIAVVKLEEGPQLMTNIVGCEPDEVAVGMAVEVAFEARGDQAVPQFSPARRD